MFLYAKRPGMGKCSLCFYIKAKVLGEGYKLPKWRKGLPFMKKRKTKINSKYTPIGREYAEVTFDDKVFKTELFGVFNLFEKPGSN